MDAARLLEKLFNQGVTLFAQGAQLIVKPGNLLTANDETLIRQHKPALVRLLDSEAVYRALVEAGPAGLAWRERTPPDWSDDRLLDASEVLYANGRMVNVLGRRYLAAQAPKLTDQWSDSPPPQTTPQTAPSAPKSGIAIDPSPAPATDRAKPLHRDEPASPHAARIAALRADGWAPWNAKARAESEASPGWQQPPHGAGDPGEIPTCE